MLKKLELVSLDRVFQLFSGVNIEALEFNQKRRFKSPFKTLFLFWEDYFLSILFILIWQPRRDYLLG